MFVLFLIESNRNSFIFTEFLFNGLINPISIDAIKYKVLNLSHEERIRCTNRRQLIHKNASERALSNKAISTTTTTKEITDQNSLKLNSNLNKKKEDDFND